MQVHLLGRSNNRYALIDTPPLFGVLREKTKSLVCFCLFVSNKIIKLNKYSYFILFLVLLISVDQICCDVWHLKCNVEFNMVDGYTWCSQMLRLLVAFSSFSPLICFTWDICFFVTSANPELAWFSFLRSTHCFPLYGLTPMLYSVTRIFLNVINPLATGFWVFICGFSWRHTGIGT